MLIYERPDQKEWGFGGQVTDDGRYLVINVWQGTDHRNRVFYRDLQAPEAKVVELLNDFDAHYSMVDNDGTTFWFSTDLDAPRSRVIAIDLARPERANWREVIPQAAESLKGVNLLHDQFVCTYLKDARSQVKIFGRDGRPVREVELPGIGSAGGFGGRRTDTETFTHSPVSVCRGRSIATTWRAGAARFFANRRWPSTQRTTRRSRSFTRARMARACRCSSRTNAG